MKPGQVLTKWWQDLVAGRLRTPQDIFRSAMQENPDTARASDRFVDGLPDDLSWQAPERLRAPHFILSEQHAKQWGRADWQHVDPRLMRWSAVFIELARKRGIPLYVHCAFRSEEEQARVVAEGHSRTSYPRSAHNIGEAVDVLHGVYHWTMTKQEWAMLHVLGRRALDLVNRDLKKVDQLHLTWGGSWSFYDPAHWEIADYRARIRRPPVGPPLRQTPRAILASRGMPPLPAYNP